MEDTARENVVRKKRSQRQCISRSHTEYFILFGPLCVFGDWRSTVALLHNTREIQLRPMLCTDIVYRIEHKPAKRNSYCCALSESQRRSYFFFFYIFSHHLIAFHSDWRIARNEEYLLRSPLRASQSKRPPLLYFPIRPLSFRWFARSLRFADPSAIVKFVWIIIMNWIKRFYYHIKYRTLVCGVSLLRHGFSRCPLLDIATSNRKSESTVYRHRRDRQQRTVRAEMVEPATTTQPNEDRKWSKQIICARKTFPQKKEKSCHV